MNEPSSDVDKKLSELLRKRIGLNPESVGKQTLEHAVTHRLKALQLTNPEDYFSRLSSDAVEWSEFLEEIIVPESWFFREVSPFECAREFARQALGGANCTKTLRFLSIPCSRGEEPYSLAMTLLDAGLSPMQFEILACDLSERSLEIARRGRYRAIAFRETDAISQRLARQYFQPLQEEWELNANIREKVRFQQANLAAPDFFMGMQPFDFIFCRNVLIYLTEEVRQHALACFKRMLVPSGLLYLGHSECRLGPQSGAVVWNSQFPAAFTWNKPLSASPTVPPVIVTPVTWDRLNVSNPSRASSASVVKSGGNTVATAVPVRKAITTPSAPHVPVTNYLLRAKELANSGWLDEAESLCKVMMREQPPSADVYCLLGVIVQARGDFAQAETHYHKALFLEPNHNESLTHMLLLAQLRGDVKQTANYQRRLERLRNEGI